MPFNLHVPLPGPFSYNKRLGGGKKRRKSGPSEPDPVAVLITIALVTVSTVAYLIGWLPTLLLALGVGTAVVVGRRRKRG
jgi:hypothetical protein